MNTAWSWFEWLVLALILAVMALIAGMVARLAYQAAQPQQEYQITEDIWVDPDTGCHYIKVANGITPRLERGGRRICSPKKQ